MNDDGARHRLDLLAMLHAAHAAESAVEARLGELGLSLTKLMALKALQDAGDRLALGQLAERLSCVKSNVTQLIDRLEADGLVTRKADPTDRRTILAALTAAGRRACDTGLRAQQDIERQLSSKLTRDEARQLAALLGKMAKP